MNRARTASAVVAAVAVLTLTACGSDTSPVLGATGSEADLRKAVQANLDAINSGDAESILDSMSARCQGSNSVEEIRQASEMIAAIYGELTLVELDIPEFDGTSALVRGRTGIQALDDESDGARWIHEDGAWRNDDCVDTGSDAGPDTDTDTDDSDSSTDSGQDTGEDLGIGETHTYPGTDVSVTVTGVREVTEFAEWDSPTEGATPFRVHLTIHNAGDAHIDLDDLFVSAEGATIGGAVNSEYFENDMIITGRLAAGATVDATWSASLDEEYGRDLVVTVGYWHDGDFPTSAEPQWAATIVD